MPKQTRREFIAAALAAGTATAIAPNSNQLQAKPHATWRSANENLRLAVIGVAGRGGANLQGVSSQDIVVLCDIDRQRLEAAGNNYPNAKQTVDFREAIEETDLDGVVISTPDHMHAIPVMTALRHGLPVYCEKPLTHSIHESRTIGQLVSDTGIVTQMGNQIHAGSNYRRVVDAIQAGVIGDVTRVHVWQGGGVRSGVRVEQGEAPAHVDYDRWLGPAPYRPFHESHFHFNWRYWWDFGSGQLGDFVCHYMDLPYWSLGLTYPQLIHATGEKGHGGDNECPNRMRVEYHFKDRGEGQSDVHVTWYHGGWKPEGAEEYGKGSAVLFEGENGRLLADYSTRQIYMNNGEDQGDVEQRTPDSIGHHLEWIEAVKGNGEASSPFTYGAKLTECGHLGNLSYRLGGREIQWDIEKGEAIDCPEAAEIVRREYREGWSLEM